MCKIKITIKESICNFKKPHKAFYLVMLMELGPMVLEKI